MYQADFLCDLVAGFFAAVCFAGFLTAIGVNISFWPAVALRGCLDRREIAVPSLGSSCFLEIGQPNADVVRGKFGHVVAPDECDELVDACLERGTRLRLAVEFARIQEAQRPERVAVGGIGSPDRASRRDPGVDRPRTS